MATVRIPGLEELTKKINSLKHLPKKEVQAEIRKAARPIVRAARANLRKNGSVKTGRLSRSIRILNDRYAGVIVGPTYGGGKKSSAPHAHLIEFGTKERRLKRPVLLNFSGNWRLVSNTGKVTAKPFLAPVVDQVGAEVVGKVNDSLERLIQKQWSK